MAQDYLQLKEIQTERERNTEERLIYFSTDDELRGDSIPLVSFGIACIGILLDWQRK